MKHEQLTQIILAPVVTEKSSNARMNHNQVVFRVKSSATKPQIRSAVEKLLDTKVAKVTTSNVKGKVKRFGGRPGRRQDWKKAYVTLQAGQTINLPGMEG